MGSGWIPFLPCLQIPVGKVTRVKDQDSRIRIVVVEVILKEQVEGFQKQPVRITVVTRMMLLCQIHNGVWPTQVLLLFLLVWSLRMTMMTMIGGGHYRVQRRTIVVGCCASFEFVNNHGTPNGQEQSQNHQSSQQPPYRESHCYLSVRRQKSVVDTHCHHTHSDRQPDTIERARLGQVGHCSQKKKRKNKRIRS